MVNWSHGGAVCYQTCKRKQENSNYLGINRSDHCIDIRNQPNEKGYRVWMELRLDRPCRQDVCVQVNKINRKYFAAGNTLTYLKCHCNPNLATVIFWIIESVVCTKQSQAQSALTNTDCKSKHRPPPSKWGSEPTPTPPHTHRLVRSL